MGKFSHGPGPPSPGVGGLLQSSQRGSGEGLCPFGPRGDSLTPHRPPELGGTSATRRLCLQEGWGEGAGPGAAPGLSGSPSGPGGSHVARPALPAGLFHSSWPPADGVSISGLEKSGQRRCRGRWGKVKNSFARCPRRGTIGGAEAGALQVLPLPGRMPLPSSPARRRRARTAAPSAEEARPLRQAPGGSGGPLGSGAAPSSRGLWAAPPAKLAPPFPRLFRRRLLRFTGMFVPSRVGSPSFVGSEFCFD